MQLWLFIHLVGFAVALGAGMSAGVINRLSIAAKGDLSNLDAAQVHLGRLSDVGLLLAFLSGGVLLWLGEWYRVLGSQLWLLLMIACALGMGALNGISTKKAKRAFEEPYEGNKKEIRKKIVILRMIWLFLAMGAVFVGVWRIEM